MPTAGKTEIVEKARRWYADSSGLIFTDYRGLTVPEIQALRQSLRGVGAEFHIVKNTLFRIAVGDDVASLPDDLHNGPTATAFLFREQPAVAKALVQFAKEHKALQIKGAFIEGKVLTAADVEALSKLPERQELLSMIVGLVAAPMANVVGALNEIIAAPLRVIDAIIDKAGGPAPEPPAVTTEQEAPQPQETAAEEAAAPEASAEDAHEAEAAPPQEEAPAEEPAEDAGKTEGEPAAAEPESAPESSEDEA